MFEEVESVSEIAFVVREKTSFGEEFERSHSFEDNELPFLAVEHFSEYLPYLLTHSFDLGVLSHHVLVAVALGCEVGLV